MFHRRNSDKFGYCWKDNIVHQMCNMHKCTHSYIVWNSINKLLPNGYPSTLAHSIFFLSNWCISKYMELIESKWIKNRNRICSLQVSKHERRNDDENWRIEKFLLNLYLTPLACWYLNRCNLTQHISPVQINHLPNPLHLPYIKWPCFKQHMPNVKKEQN